jgi:spore coat polysaccharide biosynthesis protein SpsF
MVDVAWKRHLEMGNDVTTTEGLPDGCDFEIYRIESLEMSHSLGDARHRSEYCSLYIREHRDDFIIEVLPIPSDLERNDLRLTVDNPEDLILCRRVYASLKHKAPRIPIAEIIKLIDDKPEMMELVDQYVENTRIWDE